MSLSATQKSETYKPSKVRDTNLSSVVRKRKSFDSEDSQFLKNSQTQTESMKDTRPIYLTGGTIVGKVTGNGQYIAGALSVSEQSELIGNALGKKASLVGSIDPKGSQNLTESHMAHVVKDLYNYMQQSKKSKKGILITAGTDKISYLTHALRMLLPHPTVPIVLTAAMCPPNGHKQGLGTYEDGPVNIKNADLLLRHLEEENINGIVAVMEDKAYGNHMEKVRPAGIEEAFKSQFNAPLFQIYPQNGFSSFVKDAGNPEKLKWVKTFSAKNTPSENVTKHYSKVLHHILDKMMSQNGLETAMVTDIGQNNIGDDIQRYADKANVIGYCGTGNGNINVIDSLPTIEKIILSGGKTFIRGTQSNAGTVDNHHGEAGNVTIFGNQKLTDFMIPQQELSTGKAMRTVAMLNIAGLHAPEKNNQENEEQFLNRYKDYIKNVTECLQYEHPLVKALDIMRSSDK